MNLTKLTLGLALAFSVSSLSYGYSLADSTDVGSLDTWVASTTQASLGNANPTTEQAWIESILGYSVWYEDKTEDVDLYVTQESSSVVAFGLTSQPSHFVVKDSTHFALFSNNQSMDWGVLDLAEHFGTHKLEDLQFSHVTEFNSDSVPVPEPGTSALLAAGVLGLYLSRRRNRRMDNGQA
ncbi:PEP-CTERM sorting domain-containing protein [Saccharospirillum salsuginis]|uniref:Ice-binding protein C-terminal domain-containing protein n=1 Tax=Saccharospirillum salsuginis TaxID=418750 RepID=A0A918KF18_9GAMM|nr:PEP-CTERM sorting domain-containing protein [Saccharospirillum salsuginis]GGX59795.1 hypothetical protein GCM10007392_29730 [Saccharospirillum salsuginis]